jgi:hypothetical protein
MPFLYDICPELNLLVYIGSGTITVDEYYATLALISADSRKTQSMLTLIDLLSASAIVELENFSRIIDRVNARAEKGLPVEPTAILTLDKGLVLTGETINLLPSKVPLQIEVVYTIEEAIAFLGLVDYKQEVIAFWKKTRGY